MRLSLKFALAFLVCMSVVQAVFSYQRVQREAALFDEDFRHDHETMGRDLATAVARIWELAGPDSARSFVDETNRSKSEVQIRWIPAGEDSAQGSQPAGAQAPRSGEGAAVISEEVRTPDGAVLRTNVPVLSADGGRLGTLELTESMEKAEQYIRLSLIRMGVRTSIIIALTGIVALLLGIWFVGRPVAQLVRRARQIAAGDLSGRLRVKQADELGDLGREIDAMSDRLEEAMRRVAAETTARIETLEQLRHADRLRTVGQLTSGIAHELGTPLNVVWERAKMITNDAGSPAATISARIIAEQAQRMTKIIRQLLDFSRPPNPKKARVDLRQVVRQTLTLLRPTLDGRQIHADLELSDEPVMVAVDVDQVQQVASNFLLNALQAMPGGGCIKVRVGCRRARPPADPHHRESEHGFFAVSDQGHGISAENVGRVFDPFFTTKDVGQGTGLGLSISLGIIREHGGWIDIESEPGRGARFTAYLPKEAQQCAVVC